MLLLAIIGFSAGAFFMYRKVATAPVPSQPLTAAREEERKMIPAAGVFADTPEEFENAEGRWKSENLPPPVPEGAEAAGETPFEGVIVKKEEEELKADQK